MSVVRSARDAICCDSRHIEAKRRCHAGEIWVAITVAQAHRNAAGTDLTGSGDTSDIATGSPRPWKPCGPAWRTWKWRSASLTASHAALQESLKTMCFWGPRAIRCGKPPNESQEFLSEPDSPVVMAATAAVVASGTVHFES